MGAVSHGGASTEKPRRGKGREKSASWGRGKRQNDNEQQQQQLLHSSALQKFVAEILELLRHFCRRPFQFGSDSALLARINRSELLAKIAVDSRLSQDNNTQPMNR